MMRGLIAAGLMAVSLGANAAEMPDSGPAWACEPGGGRNCMFATGRTSKGFIVMGTRVGDGGRVFLGAGIVDCAAGKIAYREDDGGMANGPFDEESVPWLLCQQFGSSPMPLEPF